MIKYILPIAIIFFACSEEKKQTIEPTLKKEVVQASPSHSYKIIFEEKLGWGYQIFNGSTLLINQTHIPAVQGLKGFETKEKATIAAEYILSEVKNGNFPPTVTVEVLDSLNVLENE
ncbi:MAG TPA: DUF4907 domain-containing protein [Crocinitomicaceae bacterium]|nr:DUF4907 domain-containing protein [Crocinitomicaceae bacterium]